MSVILLYSPAAILVREKLEALRKQWGYTLRDAERVEAENLTPDLLRSFFRGESLFLPQVRIEVKNASEIIHLPVDSLQQIKSLLKETPEDALVLFYQEGEPESGLAKNGSTQKSKAKSQNAIPDEAESEEEEAEEEAGEEPASSRGKKVKKEKKPRSFLEYFRSISEVQKIILEPPKWDGLKIWTVQRASRKGLQLSHTLVTAFLERVGERLDDIEQSLTLLGLLKKENPRVTLQDIEGLPESPEANIYKMMDFLWQGETGKSLHQLKKLQLQGVAPERVLGKVAYESRRLVQAKHLLQNKRSLSSLTEGSSWKEKKLRANLRLFPADRSKEIFLLLTNTDLRLKTTNEPAYALLEELFLRLSALLGAKS